MLIIAFRLLIQKYVKRLKPLVLKGYKDIGLYQTLFII
jgi:hypothetical protein